MSSTTYSRWSRIVAAMTTVVVISVMTVSTASAEVIDRIVAQINEEIVTLYELEQAALPFLVQQGQDPRVLENDQRRSEILPVVLDDMIDRLLVEQEAEEMGMEVSEAQIDEWMTMTQQQQGMSEAQFRQMIAQFGIEYTEYREIVRDNLLRMQIMQMRARGGAISESEVESVYRRRYGSPDQAERRLEMRHILLVPDSTSGGEQGAIERAQQLREQIVDGASFEELAEANSQGPGADSGGHIGTFRRGDLESTFEDAAFGLEDGELSEPVVTSFGVHLIEILSSEEIDNPNVDRQKEQIRVELQERQMERQMDSLLQTLRARAFVDIRF